MGSLLTASGSNSWLNCSAYAKMNKDKPFVQSTYAQEGTLAHELLEIELKRWNRAITEDKYKQEYSRIKANKLYKPEMHRHVINCVDYVFTECIDVTNDKFIVYPELRIKLNDGVLNTTAIVDIVVVNITTREIHIVDFKYGKGVKVSAVGNSQLRIYAKAVLQHYQGLFDIDLTVLHIYQPRIEYGASNETLTLDELDFWYRDYLTPRAKQATNVFEGLEIGNPTAGKHCKFCKAKMECTPYHVYSTTVLQKKDSFRNLNNNQLSILYKEGLLLKSWIEDVKEHLTSELTKGKEVKGVKLIKGGKRRYWKDQDQVIDVLDQLGYDFEEVTNTKVKGIGDISAMMSRDDFEENLSSLLGVKQLANKLVSYDEKGESVQTVNEIFNQFKQ